MSTLMAGLARDFPAANQALIREYCYGVCRWYHQLDAIAAALMDKPLRRRDTDVHCLILLGLYQLLHMRTPDHAAVNETVSVTRLLNKDWAKGLVNAVLRQAQRDQAQLDVVISSRPSSAYSHPDWLIALLSHDWPDQYTDIMTANNTQAPMTLRVNARRCTRQAYLERLQKEGIAATPGELAPTAVVLAEPLDVSTLPGFGDGLVSVQDEASQLAALLLHPPRGARVLDACAAPGGKTCAMLEHADNDLALLSLDNSEERLARVHENLGRLQLTASVICADAADPASWWDGQPFDAILLDAPCTGTGVIRRHPDIKLLRQKDDVARMTALQHDMLVSLWSCLAPGGKLLYSTCSVLRDENERQLAAFLSETPSAGAISLVLPAAVACQAGIQILPATGGPDGFYYALLEKS